ncbi:right-handed parallel beta-helix repeat-containing protein [Eubacterium xylanophilum]|uniref:right-handed parallel beta-helix repeat-containing protein n=1 Tax=Eubacterium xylanophilum TaxID=39497 RepID=UPI0004B92841|nr:right-handed parallel beta-helix repeat-containing protein [Eubacterium xylanophilum]
MSKIYVNINATNGDGSKEKPFKYIDEAAKIAKPGDEVIVAPGIYREYVNPINAGTKEAPIVYKSEKPLEAIITGAEAVTDWEPYTGNVWTTTVDNEFFGEYNPYTTEVVGDWYFSPIIRHAGAVFINDLMMYETVNIQECIDGEIDTHSWKPEDSKFKWYCEQKNGRTIFYANFQGKNPNEENVEISVRRNCFMPDKNGVDYITVDGFNIQKAATTWAPPAAYQDGMIGPHWSMGWIIENCEISNSRCCGISLGKYLDPENDMYFFTKHVKSPTQMERDAVCRGQYHGWLKEKIGHHIIRNCDVHHCEQTGIVGRMGGVFSTIENCHIHDICNSHQLGGAETAGIKLHAAIDVTIKNNHIHNCIMGIWLDWEAQGARITNNLLHDNTRPDGVEPTDGAMFNTDIFIEVGHGPTLIDNNLLLSKSSIVIPTEGVGCVHNLILGGFGLINSGVDSIVNGQREPRYTPYHIRHRTEVAGFMTILHGDDRIYNNIFVQKYPVTCLDKTAKDADYEVVGTLPFDIFPTYDEWISQFDFTKNPDMGKLGEAHFGHLPVWIEGNAYFNGAKICKNETEYFENKDNTVKVELIEENGKYSLITDLYDLLKDFKAKLIDSDILGCAFEPEQRFENPDGSDIVFDVDFNGEKRDASPIPGPFRNSDSAKKFVISY